MKSIVFMFFGAVSLAASAFLWHPMFRPRAFRTEKYVIGAVYFLLGAALVVLSIAEIIGDDA